MKNSTMFGSDICGAMNKVQLTVKQISPHSEEDIEHHLKLPPNPLVQSDKRTQVFTVLLNDQLVPINGKETMKACFLGNILMAGDEKVAELYWETPWKKVEAQKKIVFDVPSLSKYKDQILDHLHKSKPEPKGGHYIVALIFIALIITILFSWKKNARIQGYDNLLWVPFSGGVIETVVTKRAKEVDAWISRIRSSYKDKPKPIVVGLDCEWKPNTVKFSAPNKAAILQLCVGTKCLVIQLLYMEVPESVHSFLIDPDFVFVGVEVKRDIKKMSNEYGIGCRRFEDVRDLALRSADYAFCYKYGLRNLASNVVGLEIAKPAHACRSNWEARDLDEEQIQYASIDAYASYRIGHKLISEMQD